MATFDVPGPIKNLLPGALDSWRGPYATVADACNAIANVVVDGRNFREGKIVDIGFPGAEVEHRWIGGFEDNNLHEVLGDVVDVDNKRLLPSNMEFEDIHRPDLSLTGTTFVNEKLEVIPNEYDAQIEANIALLNQKVLPGSRTYLDFDRPDIKALFVEVNEKYELVNDGLPAESGGSINIDKILPGDRIYLEYHRPDIKPIFVEINEKYEIINDGMTGSGGVTPDPTPTPGTSDVSIFTAYHRPDLSLTFINEKNEIIFNQGDLPSVQNTSEYIKEFYNPPVQEQFNTNIPAVIDLNTILGLWDALITPINPAATPYITKSTIGTTSVKNMPIVRYDFKPPNPKHKVLILLATHASEKVYIKEGYEFFKILTTQWYNDPVLEWLRWNVHFTVLPAYSAAALTGFDANTNGGRRTFECNPFPVSWSKSGTDVTVTFNISDFPNTGGRLDAATYFSGRGIAGNLVVSLFDSSNTSALPVNGYRIKSVVNGNTIVVTAPTSGTATGTAKLVVSVDPNRNTNPDNSQIWYNFGSNGTMGQFSNEYTPAPQDNKGTKPFSLAETIALRNMLMAEKFDLAMDCHSGASTNYLDWSTFNTATDIWSAANKAKEYQGQFNMEAYMLGPEQVPPAVPYTHNYSAIQFNTPYYAIEWSHPFTITSQAATDSLRWMINCLVQLIKLKK